LLERINSFREEMVPDFVSYLGGISGQLEKPVLIYGDPWDEPGYNTLTLHKLNPNGTITMTKVPNGQITPTNVSGAKVEQTHVFDTIEEYALGRGLTQLRMTLYVLREQGYE
jgi:hypothetical protein